MWIYDTEEEGDDSRMKEKAGEALSSGSGIGGVTIRSMRPCHSEERETIVQLIVAAGFAYQDSSPKSRGHYQPVVD